MRNEKAAQMAVKVTADNLASTIQKILNKYGDDVTRNVEEVTRLVANKGRTAIRNESRNKFKDPGEYAKGWTVSIYNPGRFSSKATIHNKEIPGLPHLLEHGHAKVNGGRVPGRIHIAPVEEQINETYLKELERRLS